MNSREITLQELGMISGTRAVLGAGLALLVSDCLSKEQRRAVGWTMLGVGIISTIPLFSQVLSRPRLTEATSAGRVGGTEKNA